MNQNKRKLILERNKARKVLQILSMNLANCIETDFSYYIRDIIVSLESNKNLFDRNKTYSLKYGIYGKK